eukprot:TRINITY_DN11333_c0_g1_i1.p1 TRINITY_DN11333_c0_g1~~TRINITY_DN11333_c0_g1_i1.p1  ORF type:complete len:969 (-),score=145.83 TRINITY_DN11333_c0_g1_i1:194-3058(-)
MPSGSLADDGMQGHAKSSTAQPNGAAPKVVGPNIKGNREEYQLVRRLQSALFGGVYEAKGLTSNREFAIKVLHRSELTKAQESNSIEFCEVPLSEIHFAERMRGHEHVMEAEEHFEDAYCFYVVFELARGGDLLEALKQKPTGFDEGHAQFLIKQAAKGLGFLHQRCCAMQDVSLENMLLHVDESTGQYSVKVCDPGQAVVFEKDQSGQELNVNFRGLVGKSFRPPELHEQIPYISTKVDSWCLGWSTFYLLTAQPLFMSADPSQQDADWELFRAGNYAELFANKTNLPSSVGLDFIFRLLRMDPEGRLSIPDALEHPWLADPKIAPVLAPVELLPEALQKAPQRLRVKIVGAKHLRSLNFLGDAPWCSCEVKHSSVKGKMTKVETRSIPKTTDPAWNETFDLEPWYIGDSLEFTVYDKGALVSRLEGKVVVPSDMFYPHGVETKMNIPGCADAILEFSVTPFAPTGKDMSVPIQSQENLAIRSPLGTNTPGGTVSGSTAMPTTNNTVASGITTGSPSGSLSWVSNNVPANGDVPKWSTTTAQVGDRVSTTTVQRPETTDPYGGYARPRQDAQPQPQSYALPHTPMLRVRSPPRSPRNSRVSAARVPMETPPAQQETYARLLDRRRGVPSGRSSYVIATAHSPPPGMTHSSMGSLGNRPSAAATRTASPVQSGTLGVGGRSSATRTASPLQSSTLSNPMSSMFRAASPGQYVQAQGSVPMNVATGPLPMNMKGDADEAKGRGRTWAFRADGQVEPGMRMGSDAGSEVHGGRQHAHSPGLSPAPVPMLSRPSAISWPHQPAGGAPRGCSPAGGVQRGCSPAGRPAHSPPRTQQGGSFYQRSASPQHQVNSGLAGSRPVYRATSPTGLLCAPGNAFTWNQAPTFSPRAVSPVATAMQRAASPVGFHPVMNTGHGHGFAWSPDPPSPRSHPRVVSTSPRTFSPSPAKPLMRWHPVAP